MQQYQDLLIDALLDQGFTVAEAEQLVELQDRLERDYLAAQQRQEFARWLANNQKINEFPTN